MPRKVVLVTEAFVKQYLSRQNPVGSHLDFGNKEIREVVGVVGDVQQSAGFGDYGPLAPVPNVYVPAAQVESGFLKLIHTWYDPSWVVRVAGAPASVIPGIQNVAAAIDPLLPIAEFRTFDDLRRSSVSTERFQATLLAALSALALVLAIVGIYGLMSQSVVERRRELGIRMALGATVFEAIREATLPGVMLALGWSGRRMPAGRIVRQSFRAPGMGRDHHGSGNLRERSGWASAGGGAGQPGTGFTHRPVESGRHVAGGVTTSPCFRAGLQYPKYRNGWAHIVGPAL